MKTLILFAFTGLTGLVLGGFSALLMSGLIVKGAPSRFADINVNGWTSDRSIGAASADAYTRARVALHGLLALSKEEAIYFTRSTDDDGAPLLERCAYELTGGPQDAFWWSITLYDADNRLPMNDDDALSIDATTIGNAGEWTATIAPTPPMAGHWISSRAADRFDLTLRLYRPAADVIENPKEALVAPRIGKIRCESAS